MLSVNDTIRMYKKRNISMYKNVHRIFGSLSNSGCDQNLDKEI